MRKWYTTLPALLLLFAAVGCGNGDSKGPVDGGAGDGGDLCCGEDILPDEMPEDLGGEIDDVEPADVAKGEVDAVEPPDVADATPDEVEPPEVVDVPDVQPEVEPEIEPELPGEVTPEVVEPQPCELDYDCEQGESCTLGFCQDFVPECDGEIDCPEGETCLEGVCLEEGMSPLVGKIAFNEVLADGNTDGDPNEDGTKDPTEDEFVELVNVSNATVDLSGWMLVESDWEEWLPRYTFPEGTTLEPMGAVVLFGGGDAPESTDAIYYDASNAEDPGIPYGLDLDDSGDLVRLLDTELLMVAAFAYGDAGGNPGVSDESMTRDPDLTGTFIPHSFADGADGAIFSPGFRVDGTAF